LFGIIIFTIKLCADFEDLPTVPVTTLVHEKLDDSECEEESDTKSWHSGKQKIKIILIEKPVEEKVTTYTRSWNINAPVFPEEQQSGAATKVFCSKFL